MMFWFVGGQLGQIAFDPEPRVGQVQLKVGAGDRRRIPSGVLVGLLGRRANALPLLLLAHERHKSG